MIDMVCINSRCTDHQDTKRNPCGCFYGSDYVSGCKDLKTFIRIPIRENKEQTTTATP